MTPALYFGFLFLALAVSMVLIVPFIGLLYKLNFKRARQKTIDPFGRPTPIFDKFHAGKAGTPVGGGILVILVVSVLMILAMALINALQLPMTYNYTNKNAEIFVLLFTFLSFGALGLYDDVKKFFGFEKTGFFGMHMPQKLAIQVILSLIIACTMYWALGIDFINIPLIGEIQLGWLYVPFAAFVIVSFTNAVNITDGLDGLAGGVMLISLFGFWLICTMSSTVGLDGPLSLFITLFIGTLIAFVYFNVYPARIFLGDVGALSFGAILAVMGLLVGKPAALVVMGGIFVVEIFTSLVQLLSKKFLHRKFFPVAPLHLFFQKIGWQEPKIVQRFWLLQIVLTLFGIWLTLF
ncbi:phospho-N-acetylmuramoyl-pentapeptide-transferase [bacterium]|nr:phospho-N-acetylmuramoyl-pentapeptide-transferase [bacterium]